ncbi:hypothetical protein NO2_0536 [Candidatus Termititenax persephonae]|uniref:Fibronectin type-III domain-containing protein n=1 Tax=Candidatus Termititenax persephonae TaxID=2218525 RepID=A0A388THW7_9BACT|nr:hypothetical protein NO2_0536 [Candidatus Termititenax persephonae]
MLRRYIYIFIAALLFAGAGADVVPEWPVPSQPSASWQTSAANSGDTQTIHIDRPDMTGVPTTVNYWQIKHDANIISVPTDDVTYTINNINDNEIVTIYIRWSSDTSDTDTSDWSGQLLLSIGDKTAPEINNHSVDLEPNAEITIYGSDEGSGIAWTNSNITINAAPSSLNGIDGSSSGTYTPSGQKYDTTYSVSVNLSDVSGNYMMTPYTFSYTTKPIPVPNYLGTDWIGLANSGANSTDNQKITVPRPSTANLHTSITSWNMQWQYSTDTDWQSVTININNDSHDIFPVSDNCQVDVRVRWVQDDGQTSDWATDTKSIGDRTPPQVTDYNINGAPDNIALNTAITITCADEGGGIDWQNSMITINTITVNFYGDTYWPSGQKYNTTYNVSIALHDYNGNFMAEPYTFEYKTTMNAPSPPNVIWDEHDGNIGDTQEFIVTRPATGNIENITQWDVRWRYKEVPENNWQLTENIPVEEDWQTENVSDNCEIEVQVRYRENDLVSDWSNTTSILIYDRTPPVVSGHDVVGSPNNIEQNAQIMIYASDEESSIDWTASMLTINGSSIPAGSFSGYGTYGVYSPSGQKYNATYNVLVTLYDSAGNFMAEPYAFAYKTTMNVPSAPSLNWNQQALNSGDTQIFTVTRPATNNIENMTHWDVQWRYDGENLETDWRLTENIPIDEDWQITNVSDNCVVWVRVRYKDSALISDWSVAQSLTIGDRTPPQITDYNINGAPNYIEPNAEIVIYGSDEGGGITWTDSEITINNTHVFLNSSTYTPTGQKYGITYNVAVVLSDSAGNYMDSPYVFEYRTRDIPQSAPTVEWNDQGLNSADSQKITVTRPSTTNLHTSITSWNMQWKYSTDTDWQSITLNINSGNYVISPVNDNCQVHVRVRWMQDDGQTSIWAEVFGTIVKDRTIPILTIIEPLPSSFNIWPGSTVSFQLTDDTPSDAVQILLNNKEQQNVNVDIDNQNRKYSFTCPATWNETVRITINYQDAEGNYGQYAYYFEMFKDNNPPRIFNISPLGNNVTGSATFSFSVEDILPGSDVNLDSVKVLLNGDTLTLPNYTISGNAYVYTWNKILDLNTTYTLKISASDKHGLTVSTTNIFTTTSSNYYVRPENKYYATLQEAAIRANPGSTIELAKNIIYDDINVEISKNIIIQPQGGSTVTLDAEAKGRHFLIENATVTLNNISLINGSFTGNSSNDGGGSIKLINATLNVLNALIQNNKSNQYGGFIFVKGAINIYLENVRAFGNDTTEGAFFHSDGATQKILIRNSLFAGNMLTGRNLFNYATNLTAQRTDFLFNKSSNNNTAVTLFESTEYINLENCTIYGNLQTNSNNTGTIAGSAYKFQMINTIVWDNGKNLFRSLADMSALNSNIEGTPKIASVNSLSQEPKFAQLNISNTTNYDTSLAFGSPCIDRGTTNISFADGYIYDSYDIGSREYGGMYFSDFSPAVGSANVGLVGQEISFRLRNQADGNLGLNTKIVMDNKTYTGATGLTIKNLSSGIELTTKGVPTLNAQTTYTVTATATDPGDSVEKSVTWSFTTRTANVKYLFFTEDSLTQYQGFTQPITVNILNELYLPVGNVTVDFKITNTIQPLNSVYLSAAAISAQNGQAVVTLTITEDFPPGSFVDIQVKYQDTLSDTIRISCSGFIDICYNSDTGDYYNKLSKAFNDSRLASGHTIVISANAYRVAHPAQFEDTIQWPAISNITLDGNGATLNSKIRIERNNLSANLQNLNFSNIENPLVINSNVYDDQFQLTINITSCNFIDTKGAAAIRAEKFRFLNISNSTFTSNLGYSGVIYAHTFQNMRLRNSRFSQNNNIAVYLNTTGEGLVHISETLFENNQTALYGDNNNFRGNIIIENSILAGQKDTAFGVRSFAVCTINFSTLVSNNIAIKAIEQAAPDTNKLKIINSILWGNTNALDINSNSIEIYGINSYSQVALPGEDNSIVDAKVRNNYSLAEDSPAINKATADYALPQDFYGTERPLYDNYDIGAVEYKAENKQAFITNKAFYDTIQAGLDAAAEGETVIALAAENIFSTALNWPAQNITLQGINQDVVFTATVNNLTLIANNNNAEVRLRDLKISSFNNIIVQNSSTDRNSIVFDNLILQNNKGLVNSSKPVDIAVNNSIISGNSDSGARSLFHANTTPRSSLHISDTLISGNSNSGSGSLAGSIDVFLTRVTVNGNSAQQGGVFAGSSNPETGLISNVSINDSVFFDNRSTNGGGGVFFGSNVTASRTVFRENKASGGSNYGAVFRGGTVYIDHAIFYNNQTDASKAGSVAYNSVGQIQNSVFGGNNGNGNNIQVEADKSLTLNNNLSDRDLGAGNLNNSAPLFVNAGQGDYRVTYNSLLIDGGTTGTGDIYDTSDIGLYEYADTYLSHYTPTQNALDVDNAQTISFRVRNSHKKIEPETLTLKVSNHNNDSTAGTLVYHLPTADIVVDNHNTDQYTDFTLNYTPSPSFRYNSTVTLNIQVDNVNHTYLLHITTQGDIYVHPAGHDQNNDGTSQLPYRTIGRALDIARDDAKIFLDEAVFTENLNWPNKNNISLIGTSNSVLAGDIKIENAVSVNLKHLTISGGQIRNTAGRLCVDGLRSFQNTGTVISNTGYAHIQNSIFAYNDVAVENSGLGQTEIIYSNFVSNNTIINSSGQSARLANSILYNNTQSNFGHVLQQNNLVDINPLFLDENFEAVTFNSPAVDAGNEDIAEDIRGVARPEHHLPDIGAYESNWPNIILIRPSDREKTNVIENFLIRIVETPSKIATQNITIIGLPSSQSYTVISEGYELSARPRPALETNVDYTIKISAQNNGGHISELIVTFHTTEDLTEVFVDPSNSGELKTGQADYPFTTLQEALNYFTTRNIVNATINMAEAVYPVASTIIMPNNTKTTQNIAILGNRAVLDGGGNKRILQIGSKYTLYITDLNFVNGKVGLDEHGGAIYSLADLKISGGSFSGNKADNGGALYAAGQLELAEVDFKNNLAEGVGGAVYIERVASINDSLFWGNEAKDPWTGGGAIYNAGSLTVNNTTFKENSASLKDGGGIVNGGVFYGQQLIASGNSAMENGGFLYNLSASCSVLERSLFRNNIAQASDGTKGGGAIYNNNGRINLINSIFDHNRARYGGAIFHQFGATSQLYVYFSTFVRNSASYGGAIYSNNLSIGNISQIAYSAFAENTAENDQNAQGPHYQSINSGPPPVTDCYPPDLQSPGEAAVAFNNPDIYDYVPAPGSPLINAVPDPGLTSVDFANKPRDTDNDSYFDIGALDYRASIRIPAGYYIHDELGNVRDFTVTSTITIGRRIAGQEVGQIVIPSSNNINYAIFDNRLDLSQMIITPDMIYIPSGKILDGKTYQLHILSTTTNPFVSADGKVLSDFDGVLTANNKLLGDSVTISATNGSYLVSAWAKDIGAFSLIYPQALRFTPDYLIKNYALTSNFTVQAMDAYDTVLSGVPIALSIISGNGTLDRTTATWQAAYGHPTTIIAEGVTTDAVIKASFEELSVTMTALTINDPSPPIIQLLRPQVTENVKVTQDIAFIAFDNQSNIAAASLILLLNGLDEAAQVVFDQDQNQFILTKYLEPGKEYAVTISIENNAGLSENYMFTFQTKPDNAKPDIHVYPTPNQEGLYPQEAIHLHIQDWESGISLSSLTLEVDNHVAAYPIINVLNTYNIEVLYYPERLYNLNEKVFVTVNVQDKSGNQLVLAYYYRIIADYTPPTVNIISLEQTTPNEDTALLEFTAEDIESVISLNSLLVLATDPRRGTVLTNITILNLVSENYLDGSRLTANVLLSNLGYGQETILNLILQDSFKNSGSADYELRTTADTIFPAIVPISPTPNGWLDMRAPLIIDLLDNESGIDLAWLELQFDGEAVSPYINQVGKNYRLEYWPPETLSYSRNIKVSIKTRDRSGNETAISYNFTVDDLVPPAQPDVDNFVTISTNAALVYITGRKAPNSSVSIYINDIVQQTSNSDEQFFADYFDATLNLANMPSGNLIISVVAYNQAGKPSPTSNLIALDFVDESWEFPVKSLGSTINVFVPAGTFAEETTVYVSKESGIDDTRLNIYDAYNISLGANPPEIYGYFTVCLPLSAAGISDNAKLYWHNGEKWVEFGGDEYTQSLDGQTQAPRSQGVTIDSVARSITFQTQKTGRYAFGTLLNLNSTKVDEYDVLLAPNPVKLASGPVHFIYRAPNACAADVRIYSLSGRLLTRFSQDLLPAMEYAAEFVWGGENSYNETIGNGVYIVIITLTDQVTGKKHVLKKKLAVLN